MARCRLHTVVRTLRTVSILKFELCESDKLNPIATPLPNIAAIGPIIQNARIQPLRRNSFKVG